MAEVILERTTRKRPGAGARIKRFIRTHGWGYLFILPSMLTFLIFIVIPVFWALIISFQDYDFYWDGKWAGLNNYIRAFTTGSGVFTQAIGHTLYYTVITVTANVLIALILAGLVQGRNKYVRTFFIAAYYLPAVTSVVIIAITWRWLYNSEFGLFNYLIGLLHVPPVRWLSNPDVVLNSITLSTIL